MYRVGRVRSVLRPILLSVACAAIGAAALVAVHARTAGFALEMNAAPPPFVSGFHPPERDGSVTFAWTSERVIARLDGLDRRRSWSCTLRFRGPRPEGLPAAVVDVLVDEARVAQVTASGEFHDLGFLLPRSAGRTTMLAVVSTPTFTPGPQDRRALGVQVDRLSCRPEGLAWPPAPATRHVAGATWFFGTVCLLLGFGAAAVLLSATSFGAGIAVVLTSSAGVFGDYSGDVLLMSVWVTIIFGAALSITERTGRHRLTPAARAVFAISAVALLVKLTGLMHPGKPIIDALFHAHRLADVVGGRYLFSQPVAGVQMPYAIGLYVFAWPWTWIVGDHVALIRTVVLASDVIAAALLYPVVLGAWGNRRAAALAVLFYQLAPLPYSVLGNANLTNMFGQTVALLVVLAAVAWRLDVRRAISLAAFVILVTWAFCSHVSTITMLAATLGVMVVLYWWRGDTARRRSAAAIVVAGAAAAALAWLVYYWHFADVFAAAFGRMFSGGSSSEYVPSAAEAARGYMGIGGRLTDLMLQGVSGAGWPLVILMPIGIWIVWKRGVRDRLLSALLAWAAMWMVFSLSTVVSPVGPEFVRYAAEFLGRINLAALPLVAILAAQGASAGWDDTTPAGARPILRAIAVVLIAWAFVLASLELVRWFER